MQIKIILKKTKKKLRKIKINLLKFIKIKNNKVMILIIINKIMRYRRYFYKLILTLMINLVVVFYKKLKIFVKMTIILKKLINF